MSDITRDNKGSLADAQRMLNRQVRQLSDPLSRASGWMKLLAILSIISVVPTLIYAWWYLIYLWLPVWTAILLFQTATHVSKASRSGSDEQLSQALDKLRLYFKISGVIALVGIVLGVIGIFFAMPHWLGG